MIYEKRPGCWKIEGSAKIYPSKEAAEAVVGVICPPAVEEIVEEPVFVIDPLEALRKARMERDGNIEEGSDNGSHNEDDFEELFEGSD